MLRRLFTVVLAIALGSHDAGAGAFMLPQGAGQFIAGIGYSEGARRFQPNGMTAPQPAFRKTDASGYLEYGWTSWLNVIAAPTLARQSSDATATNTITGSDSTALGARLLLFARGGTSVAFQALVQPPLGKESAASMIADGGMRAFAVDLRLPVGRSFLLFGMPAFLEIEPGVRLRAAPFPTEARADVAAGLRPLTHVLILTQIFVAYAPSAGPLIARSAYAKLQATLVYDLSPRWSLQAGGFRTIAGLNSVQEMGPLAGVWYRF